MNTYKVRIDHFCVSFKDSNNNSLKIKRDADFCSFSIYNEFEFQNGATVRFHIDKVKKLVNFLSENLENK